MGISEHSYSLAYILTSPECVLLPSFQGEGAKDGGMCNTYSPSQGLIASCLHLQDYWIACPSMQLPK